MSTVSIRNNTSNNFSFEARVLTLQGQHVTVRATLLAGQTTAVALPNGVTPEMLAQAPEVQSEQSSSSPRWSIQSVSADVVGGLSDYEVLRAVQAAPASATIHLGCVQRGMKLSKLRLCSTGPAAAGESYEITELHVNGVNVLPAGQTLTLPELTAAFTDVSGNLSGSWTEINEGDYISVVTVLTAGSTLANVSIEVVGSKA